MAGSSMTTSTKVVLIGVDVLSSASCWTTHRRLRLVEHDQVSQRSHVPPRGTSPCAAASLSKTMATLPGSTLWKRSSESTVPTSGRICDAAAELIRRLLIRCAPTALSSSSRFASGVAAENSFTSKHLTSAPCMNSRK